MERTGVDSAKRIVELEAQRDQLKEENVKLKAREVRLKERLESEESKWREEEDEIRAKCWLAESEKRKLEIDLKVAVERVADGGISDKLKAAEAEAARLDSSLKESRLETDFHSRKAMEAEKQKKVEEEKALELLQKIEVSEKEISEFVLWIVDALCKGNRSEREEIKRMMYDEMAEAAVKRAMSEEGDEEMAEGGRRTEVLNMKKRLKVGVIKMILNDKAKLEKTNSELVSRVEVLERQKRGLEMETMKKDQENKLLVQKLNDSSAPNKKILAMGTNSCTVPIPQQMHPNPMMNVGYPTAHYQGFPMTGGNWMAGAMPTYHKEEFRKTVKEKNPNSKSVTAVSKAASPELKMISGADKAPYIDKAVRRRKENGKSLTASYKKPDGGGETVVEESDKSGFEEDDGLQLNGDKRQASGSENQRRKVEALGCIVASQVGAKRSKSELVWSWTTPETMLDAFTASDELCMRSVCVLYRKHKSLGPWKSCLTTSIGGNGFKPPYEARGVILGELLTNRDPEGGQMKSLAEFERDDSRGPEDCRDIAREHYKELFELYRHDVGPIHMLGGDMN